MKRIALICLLSTLTFLVNAQDTAFRVLFYNVENLFDIVDDPDTKDEEYTPDGALSHTKDRYQLKIDHLSKVIDASFGKSHPNILGLCEVENRTVVEDLVRNLAYADYTIIHQDSPDGRGIDNAMAVDEKVFEIVDSGFEKIDLGEENYPTRDIVWARLKMRSTGNEIMTYVNHWPSRYGGAEQSEPKRIKASETLISLIAKHRQINPEVGIIVMGDFNDHPDNNSIRNLVRCSSNADVCLTNLHERFTALGQGSYAYRKNWEVLDQILISQDFFEDKNKVHATKESGGIVKKQWMLYESNDGLFFPSRMYGRDRFFGGYSDHLPVTASFLD